MQRDAGKQRRFWVEVMQKDAMGCSLSLRLSGASLRDDPFYLNGIELLVNSGVQVGQLGLRRTVSYYNGLMGYQAVV